MHRNRAPVGEEGNWKLAGLPPPLLCRMISRSPGLSPALHQVPRSVPGLALLDGDIGQGAVATGDEAV